MKKICLYRKENGNENLQGRYDNVEEAQDTVKKLTEDEGNGSIFDYFYKEQYFVKFHAASAANPNISFTIS